MRGYNQLECDGCHRREPDPDPSKDVVDLDTTWIEVEEQCQDRFCAGHPRLYCSAECQAANPLARPQPPQSDAIF